MPQALVRGVVLNYEVFGTSGPFIALTPGSRRSYAELVDLSQQFAKKGYRVLLHDRRNCGASDVVFDGSSSEYEVWADDLVELARQLDALPLYVGGSSAGARLAMLFALRHTKSTRGLLLWRVTGGQHAANELAENYYGAFIKLAQNGGMEAVAASEHFADCIKARPSNRERLLSLPVEPFIKVMEMWREHFIRAANMPMIGATEEQLRALNIPVCVIAGNDMIHTPVTSRKLASLVPNCELHDDVVRKFDDANLLKDWDRKEWKDVEPHMLDIFSNFLKKQG